MITTSKWVTQKQFKDELEEKYRQEISYQRIKNWIERGKVKSKTVYSSFILIDRTSLKIDLVKKEG